MCEHGVGFDNAPELYQAVCVSRVIFAAARGALKHGEEFVEVEPYYLHAGTARAVVEADVDIRQSGIELLVQLRARRGVSVHGNIILIVVICDDFVVGNKSVNTVSVHHLLIEYHPQLDGLIEHAGIRSARYAGNEYIFAALR